LLDAGRARAQFEVGGERVVEDHLQPSSTSQPATAAGRKARSAANAIAGVTEQDYGGASATSGRGRCCADSNVGRRGHGDDRVRGAACAAPSRHASVDEGLHRDALVGHLSDLGRRDLDQAVRESPQGQVLVT